MTDAIIVGAGLAGLATAVRLQEEGKSCLVLEASDGVGGRVRTDLVDGFRLDRGFQVFLDAYPRSGELLDFDALDLRRFEPGALVFAGGNLHRVMDVFRRPTSVLSSVLAPIGSPLDKLRVAALKLRATRTDLTSIQKSHDTSTRNHLESFGFSASMINGFFRSFYGGIFLEDELRTSSRMFEFTFKMFSEGYATLPARGMQEIPNQLADRLKPGTIKFETSAARIESGVVQLKDQRLLKAAHIIVATDASAAARLLPGCFAEEPSWRSVTNLYFKAAKSPIQESLIALNGSGNGLVNNVCVLTQVSADYAPPGQHLISVACLGLPEAESLSSTVKQELETWFGPEVRNWSHLRTDQIPHALPEQTPGALPIQHEPLATGIHLCGDYQASASIEGAINSGLDVAGKVLRFLAASN